MLVYTAEHGVPLMRGHYKVLDKFGFHGERKGWRASFLLKQGERFTKTLWAQINPEEIPANIQHTTDQKHTSPIVHLFVFDISTDLRVMCRTNV